MIWITWLILHLIANNSALVVVMLTVWLGGKVDVLSWCLPLSFWRCKWIGIRPVIASISRVGEAWKISRICKVVLYCIFLSSLSEYNRGALL